MAKLDLPDPRRRRGGLRPAALRALVAERVRLLRLLPLAGRRSTAALLAVMATMVLTGPAVAVLTGELLDEVTRAGTSGESAWVIAGLSGTLLLQQLVRPLSELLMTQATRQIDGALRARVRLTALAPATISHLDEAEFQNDAARASEIGEGWWVRSAGTAAYSSMLLAGRVLSAAASALVLARWFPWLAAFLLLASLLNRSLQRRQWTHLVAVGDQLTEGQRRVDYFDELAAGPAAAKEIRLFGLADWVVNRRSAEHWELRAPYWALRRSLLRHQGLTVALSVSCGASALLVPGWEAAQGTIGVGALGVCLTSAMGVVQITLMGYETFDIEYGKGAVQAVDRLVAQYGEDDRLVAQYGAAEDDRPAPARPSVPVAPGQPARRAPAVRFEHVEFSYPGTDQPVLRNLDLTIEPGEVLAVVGVNGAGKTTLTKLLAGLYPPTRGRITVDGRSLGGVPIAAWRRRLSVVYQDFVRYPATVRDNISWGAPEHIPEPDEDSELLEVARRSGTDPLLRGLPRGLDTQLWRTGSGGQDLSGGQWQKLAIARVLHATGHGRDLIVLDEPTANLDVRAEIEFFEKVVAGARSDGVSVVLISHRLSTLRQADRIVVLDDGAVTESGNHDQLLAAGGTYARLWRLQASRFTDHEPPFVKPTAGGSGIEEAVR
ncbi:ABC transporter ATP-binding protein [Streptomyces sp. NPDC058295]|uniref:ABC transporter ATP-binding protein n=1 Tax=Streptomyces sp. NPDC058295 TaxID=3346431 RepID=UPI0036EEC690